MLRELSTVPEVIEALGGAAKRQGGRRELARLTGKQAGHVSNWLAAGRLPAWTIWIVTEELERRGYAVAATVFGLPAKPSREEQAQAS